jgi:spermidine synthase
MLRHRRSVQALLVIFLLSGATSLIYETIWARQLHLVFGTSQLAISTLLAAFMAGLALGGFGAARWAGRVRRPLIAYAWLEAAIGAYALVFPWLLELATPLYLWLFRALEPGPTLFAFWQFLLLGLLLLPPTICMGATLPLLARFATSRPQEAGYQVGRLYGVNTLGAVLGAGLAGFVLLPGLGLMASNWTAAAANGLLALAALALAAGSASPPAPALAGGEEPRTKGLAALLLVAGLSGFAALLCELAWFRLLTLILGGSAYAFSIMLLAFLLGIGLGGWAGGWAADKALAGGGRARVLAQLACLHLGVAALVWAAMFLYGELPYGFVWLYTRLEAQPWLLWPAKLGMSLAVMLPPALLMGASFPYLVRAAAGRVSALSRTVGHIYGVNTLGALLGAAAGGMLLLPGLAIVGSVTLAAAINLAAAMIALGLLAAARRPRAGRLAWAALAICLAGVALFFWRPPWNPILMTSGMYRYVYEMPERSRRGMRIFAITPFELLYYQEGLSSVVSVAKNRATGNIWLAHNGKVDASTNVDMKTQVLLAHLPLAFRPGAKRLMVIGLASGITAGSAALHKGPERIDLVEIEPATVAASRFFEDYNHRPLDDPRVKLLLGDARNRLLLASDGSYDLISSEPSNPWISGVSNLFTKEFFELGAKKLAPGGVWAQWLHSYGMSGRDLRSLLTTFAGVYKHAGLFRVSDSDLILLGSQAPLELDAAKLAGVLAASQAVADDLAIVGVLSGIDLVAMYQMGRDSLLKLGGQVPVNTDDNMLIEYSAPRNLYRDTTDANSRLLLDAAEIPLGAVRGAAGLKRLATAYALGDWNMSRALQTIEAARRLAPGDPSIKRLRAAYMAKALRQGKRRVKKVIKELEVRKGPRK